MILVVDIGNTTVSFGGVEIRDSNTYTVRFRTKLDTNCTWDAADYTVHLLKRLKSLGRELEDFSGVVISSVVPRVLEVIREAAYSIFGVEPLVITQESKLGIAVEVPEPEEGGRDRLVACAWAAGRRVGARPPPLMGAKGAACSAAASLPRAWKRGSRPCPAIRPSCQSWSWPPPGGLWARIPAAPCFPERCTAPPPCWTAL